MKAVHLFTFIAIVSLLQGCYKDPLANFEYSYKESMAPASVSFTNLSTEADKFEWNFGDGTTSAAEDPVHDFYNIVDLAVTLRATGRGGENQISKNVGITSYFVRNSYEYTLNNTRSFFLDGTLHVDEFSLGTIYSGYDSDVVITHHDVIHVSFEVSGIDYITDPAFELIENGLVYIEITGETSVSILAQGYKGSSPRIKVKDLFVQ